MTPQYARWLGRWGREPYEDRLLRRFWEKVDLSGGPEACWIWTGKLGVLAVVLAFVLGRVTA